MAPNVYEIVTDRIVALLEAGTVPWRKTWNAETSAPRNVDGRPYRGVNAFLLACSGYSDPRWVTYKRAQALGGYVRRGERSTPVAFWKVLEKRRDEAESRREGEHSTRDRMAPFLRHFNVFNVEQTEGLNLPALDRPTRTHTPLEACERIVAGYVGAPEVVHGGGIACYEPARDLIRLPMPESFDSPAAYYAVRFHETGHSTGHAKRLARDGVTNVQRFGSHAYSREELVAEMAAAFLGAEAGISAPTINNSAAYIANWVRVLRADTRAVVVAAAQAQKAADWIVGTRRVEVQEPSLANAA